ncbi:hypothetical protein TeGR_g4212 [Tetraparma gracilis]|uniref:Uncharacterized protein n=1 Tax=Tetraparma gracilis TaxID=2962635 RepID=A0ABQ6N0K7_9STRA|nr:hypothetical protein TeGR_g4212 [Tetraparma gracilis]
MALFGKGKKNKKGAKDKETLMPSPNKAVNAIKQVGANVGTGITKAVDGAKAINTATANLVQDLGIAPPLEPVPPGWWLLLVLITGLPIGGWVISFSAMGWGRDCMKFAIENSNVGYYSLTVVFLILCTLYILDFSYWTSPCMINIKKALLGLCAIGFIVGTFFMAADYPYSPLTVFFLCMPMYLLSWRHMLFRDTSRANIDANSTSERKGKTNFRNYISWLPGPLFFWAFVIGVGWTAWTFADDTHEWGDRTRDTYSHFVKCPPNEEYQGTGDGFCDIASLYDASTNTWTCGGFNYPPNVGDYVPIGAVCGSGCANVYDTCLDAFMIWSTPFLCGLVYFILSFTFYFLNPDHKEASVQAFMKMFMFICFLFWVASSLAASNAGITSALMSFILVALLAGALVGIGVHGVKTFKDDVENNMVNKFKEKYGGYATFFKGMLILTCGPVILGYWCIASINQMVRRLGLPLTKQLDDSDRHFALTKVAAEQKEMIRNWKWTPVLSMSIKIGIFVQVMGILVTKFTYLGLAWLRNEISDWHWGAVSGMMIAIGITLFLLPPVPGVPIYFVSGLMLVGVCEKDMGLGGGTIYCICLGLVLKLCACTLQQKMIGENFKSNVGIRQMCNVNSDLMRTMKVILSRPGLSMAKCSILIGGPDWPTSVLCGIMGLDLLPVLVGTIPVLLLIAPTVASGLFVFLTDRYEWAGTLSTVCLSATGMAQSASMVMAAYYLEQAVRDEKDEIAKIPIDQEVADADAKQEAKDAVFAKCTEWKVLPTYMKVNLLAAHFEMQVSCYLTMLFSTSCFAAFEMTSSIDDLGSGNPLMNLVLGPGWIAIALFAVSGLQLFAFGKWAGGQVNQYNLEHPAEEESTLAGILNTAADEGGRNNSLASVTDTKL